MKQYIALFLFPILMLTYCKRTYEICTSKEKVFAYDNSKFELVPDFSDNPGNLMMYRFVPAKMPKTRRPLVVVLHGCYGSAEQISLSGWNEMARKYKFYVLYPEQKTENNPIKCFNWFQPEDSKRETGEAYSIKKMIDKMISDYRIDRRKIYATGFSSGAFMAVVMGATYPDIIRGISTVSGGPYGCTSDKDASDGFMDCIVQGATLTPEEWKDRVTHGSIWTKHKSKQWPRVSIWHGSLDKFVSPHNQADAMKQWTELHDIEHTPSTTQRIGDSIIHNEYKKKGVTFVETYTFANMGHSVPIKPPQCGEPNEWFSMEDICFTERCCEFFGINR
jgi:poly(hydroxyalkanoate) depolymerase family esterase